MPVPSESPAERAVQRSSGAGYMKEVDGLRGLAITSVILSHFPPTPFFDRMLPWGAMGVQLFFVISGFLITGILLRGRDEIGLGRADHASVWRGFIGRRVLRIFPVYYATLLLLYLANLGDVRHLIGYEATYVTDFLVAAVGKPIGSTTHFWSLAVEEQFYLVWPWVILATPERWLIRVVALFGMVAPFYRLIARMLHWNPFATQWVPFGTLDTLCGGALLAIMFHRVELHRIRDWLTRFGLRLGTLGLALISIGRLLNKGNAISLVFEGLVYTLLFGGLVSRAAQASTGVFGRFLSWRPLVSLGQISYCVYIVHFLLPEVFDRLAQVTGVSWLHASWIMPIRLVQMFVPAVLIAAASRRWFEGPLLRYKRLFTYAKPRSDLSLAELPPASG